MPVKWAEHRGTRGGIGLGGASGERLPGVRSMAWTLRRKWPYTAMQCVPVPGDAFQLVSSACGKGDFVFLVVTTMTGLAVSLGL